jgi:AraC family transcriptional regulator
VTVPALGENCYLCRMTQNIDRAELTRDKVPVAHAIAHGRDWSIAEYLCDAGPGDRSFEERHESFTIAAVLEGVFCYRADTGTSLMHPGAFLLGNFGTCFECGHDHSRGDRCVAFHFSPDYFAEVAASAGGSSKIRFRTGMLPPGQASLSWLARTQSLIARSDALQIGESVAELMEIIVAASLGSVPSPQRVSASDERRISATLHLLEQGFSEAIDLDRLAEVAMMSKYHFLRTFRRIVGMTPYQYLLGLRLRHAAVRLAMSSESISAIAFETGFGDLSTFNERFRRQLGTTPSRYRAQLRERRT